MHASQCGSRKVAIRTVDTDVVVLAICFFMKLNLDELWIHFGVGKHVRLIAAHDIACALGASKCAALPVFHCMTGCDTVSCFSGKGKKSAWEAWKAYPAVTAAFLDLYNVSGNVNQATLCTLERFVILMYDRKCDSTDLDASRRYLFTKKLRTIDLLPPTSNAFLQHVKRTIHQAIHTWGQCLLKNPEVHDPCKWGWISNGDKWTPLWMTIPEVSKICKELESCKCKNKVCAGNCNCSKKKYVCTALCSCDGDCRKD